jgi:hypothetical protein
MIAEDVFKAHVWLLFGSGALPGPTARRKPAPTSWWTPLRTARDFSSFPSPVVPSPARRIYQGLVRLPDSRKFICGLWVIFRHIRVTGPRQLTESFLNVIGRSTFVDAQLRIKITRARHGCTHRINGLDNTVADDTSS